MIKQSKDAGICWNKKEKATRGKIPVQLEEINQKVLAKEGRLKRYRQRIKQYRQNRTFQKKMKENSTNNWEEMTRERTNNRMQKKLKFWKKIWQPKENNGESEWLNNITKELEGFEEGPKAEIQLDLLKTTLRKISNWKTPGHDGMHGFRFKKFSSIHYRLALEMNRCLQGAQVPEWMTKGKTTLIQKDPSKGTALNNYRPITSLPMMWKI